MLGPLIVSFCGVALPLVAGVYLAPKDGTRALATSLRGNPLIEQIHRCVSAQSQSYVRSLAATIRQRNSPVRAIASSMGHLGRNLVSGSYGSMRDLLS